MKLRLLLALLSLPFLASGEEEEEAPAPEEEEAAAPEKPAPPADNRDATQLLKDLIEANAAKDPAKIAALLAPIANVGKTSKAEAEVDALAVELAKSLQLKDLDLQKKVLETFAELRSKKAAGALKRIAFDKKVEGEKEEEVKAKALVAIGTLRDPGNIEAIVDAAKDRSVIVAKGAYEALKSYATAKGAVRHDVAEHLMKRLDAEYPAAPDGKKVGEEARKRWAEVSPLIVAALQAVCRQDTIVEIDNWREWWKENKKNPKAWKDEKQPS